MDFSKKITEAGLDSTLAYTSEYQALLDLLQEVWDEAYWKGADDEALNHVGAEY
jgi:hypothetical protein